MLERGVTKNIESENLGSEGREGDEKVQNRRDILQKVVGGAAPN